MNIINSPRLLNLAAFIGCAGLLAYAYYSQFVLGLEPCPLCIFQRVGVIAVGLVFLAAALHGPSVRGRKLYGIFAGLAAIGGGAVAARHVWLQNLPPDQVPACGPGLDYMLEVFPLSEALRMAFTGSGECAKVSWELLGISMPGWVLAAFVALGLFGVWNNWRKV